MKNLTTTLGAIGALVTAVSVPFKSLHFPGASILIIIGATLLAIYALLYMAEKRKSAGGSTEKTYITVFGITGMIMSLAFLFKSNHWPGAGWLIYAFFAAYVVLVVMAIIRIIQAGDPEAKRQFINNFIFLLGIGIILMYPVFYALLNP